MFGVYLSKTTAQPGHTTTEAFSRVGGSFMLSTHKLHSQEVPSMSFDKRDEGMKRILQEMEEISLFLVVLFKF